METEHRDCRRYILPCLAAPKGFDAIALVYARSRVSLAVVARTDERAQVGHAAADFIKQKAKYGGHCHK